MRGRCCSTTLPNGWGSSELLDEELQVKTRERGYGEGQAISGLVYNLILGGAHLSDLDVLRGDPGTQELLEAETILAPTTAGEFLRKFDIGDVHDLHAGPLGGSSSGCGPTSRPRPVRLIWTRASMSKLLLQRGVDKAYNGEVGYHPLFAFWAEEGELLFSHLRRGSAHTARNILWFLRQTRPRVPDTADQEAAGR